MVTLCLEPSRACSMVSADMRTFFRAGFFTPIRSTTLIFRSSSYEEENGFISRSLLLCCQCVCVHYQKKKNCTSLSAFWTLASASYLSSSILSMVAKSFLQTSCSHTNKNNLLTYIPVLFISIQKALHVKMIKKNGEWVIINSSFTISKNSGANLPPKLEDTCWHEMKIVKWWLKPDC